MSQTPNAARQTSPNERCQPGNPVDSRDMNPESQPHEPRPPGRRRRHRHPRRKRHRRPSFAVPPSPISDNEQDIPQSSEAFPSSRPADIPEQAATPPVNTRRPSLYNLSRLGANLSGTSFDSQELLDHRHQPRIRTRRDSRLAQSSRPEFLPSSQLQNQQPKTVRSAAAPDGDESDSADDRTPLIKPTSVHNSQFVRYGTDAGISQSPEALSPNPSSLRAPRYDLDRVWNAGRDYDVNNPPSVPGSPLVGPDMGYNDALITGHDFEPTSTQAALSGSSHPRDAVIDIDEQARLLDGYGAPDPVTASPGIVRRRTVALPVEEDVCFPTEGLSDLAEEDFVSQITPDTEVEGRRRRRRRIWPDLSVLEEWSREEKEERSGGIRAKTVSEPVLIGGRLRTRNAAWKSEEEDAPYRFTYFNEEFPSTIHSQTISELVQPGQTFRNLFIPDPPELESDSSDDEVEDCDRGFRANSTSTFTNTNHTGRQFSRQSDATVPGRGSGEVNFDVTKPGPKEKRYGPRPTFWLDVLCPTDTEMRVLAKAFGIHALTAEDIMMQEAREKVELFRHYYFINYRTFEQDTNSPNYLEPVNMYVVVFREGLLSFHFSMTPHPANVRRRIRQLKDYLILSADWISYAIIDDITDVFGPLIQAIEDEVDRVDDTVLGLHSDEKDLVTKVSKVDENNPAALDSAPSGSDMLRRVGECRKKVMGLYRLLGNKADVIKGFAKRCNEQWEVAPKSEIGLYLGDIQDHILTMTGNLTHYETLLSRAHSNYLALINIRMNERQEQTADVLGKLTVLGTIVLPMNIICGMWGMNVKVPGQDQDNLYWFWSITAGLVGFAVCCFYVAKRVYGIV